MILKTVPALALSAMSSIKTRRKAPFVVVPPCQSEIKRTLRRASCVRNGLAFSEHSKDCGTDIDADGERRVSENGVGYGFEKVDAAGAFDLLESHHQSNIYAESNQSGFPRIFGDLTSMQTLAIYGRLLVRERLRDQPQSNQKPPGREMFFLLRMAFWLGLVLVLLPREKTPASDKLPQVGASQAVSAASAAVSDMGQFCKRQPLACEVGGQAASVIGHRAQEGARKLYQIITDKRASDHTGSIGEAAIADASLAAAAPGDTLTRDDLMVEWRTAP